MSENRFLNMLMLFNFYKDYVLNQYYIFNQVLKMILISSCFSFSCYKQDLGSLKHMYFSNFVILDSCNNTPFAIVVCCYYIQKNLLPSLGYMKSSRSLGMYIGNL